MKAVDAHLLTFLEGKKQFQIPIYQRTYSWGIKQCTQLLKDIIGVGGETSGEAHFIGSIVYFQPEIVTTTGVPKFLVIDGQQRLTTVVLLLLAVKQFLNSNSETTLKDTSGEEIQDSYLFNPHKNGEDKFKLLLTKKDKETLIKLLEAVPLGENSSIRVKDNFEYFIKEITPNNVQEIYNGIQKLLIVDAALEFGKDNPQLIFESLNSTGLDLSQADLIRNFIIMGQPQTIQENVYNQSWFPMEQLFENNISKMTNFFRDYLTVTTGKIPKYERVYEAFKEFIKSKEEYNVEETASHLLSVAEYYTNFALGKENDEALRSAFQDLKHLKVDVSFPLLLSLYVDYRKDLFDKNQFIEMLRMIESYVFRRAICEIPTNSMNKTFSLFHKHIDKNDYVDSYKAHFHLLDSYKRFPRNKEFIHSFKERNIYKFRSRSFLLGKLENFERKEKINIEDYTIEHIMPQTITEEWENELGPNWKVIYDSKLHTIGNLTLTGYNSEMSNNSFSEKRNHQKGFKNSPLVLNEKIRHIEQWNEGAITERANILSNRAVEIFQLFSISDQVLDKYRKSNEVNQVDYSIDHFEMADDIFSCFEKLSHRIENLDSSITKEIKKLYIAFKSDTNFVDIVPQKKRLWLTLNMDINQVYDPKGLCLDITGLGRWGNGNVRLSVAKDTDIDYAMEIISQSLELQLDNN